jgi:hypothetical protein
VRRTRTARKLRQASSQSRTQIRSCLSALTNVSQALIRRKLPDISCSKAASAARPSIVKLIDRQRNRGGRFDGCIRRVRASYRERVGPFECIGRTRR